MLGLPRARRRGFTIVELMAVVAIVGILAALAVYGYKRYVQAAAASEVKQVFEAVIAGEHVYKEDNLAYLDCSGGDLSAYFPHDPPDTKKWSWTQTGHADWPKWQRLGVSVQGVKLVYAVAAGAPGATPPSVPGQNVQPVWPATETPWFVVHAAGDVNGNGVRSSYVASSFNHEIHGDREDE